MKKLIAVILSLVCVVCVVGFIVYNTLPKKYPVSNGVLHSDIEGVFVEIDGIYKYPDITALGVTWNNQTEYTISYGNAFGIERLENGEWVDCSLKSNVFTLTGYSLNSNEKVEKKYRITDMYDISKSGTYRFLATCSRMDINEGKSYSVWAEFVIE